MVKYQLYTRVKPMDTWLTHQILPSSTLLPDDSKVVTETIDEKNLPTWKTKVIDQLMISTTSFNKVIDRVEVVGGEFQRHMTRTMR